MKANRNYIWRLIEGVEDGDVSLKYLQKEIDKEFQKLENEIDKSNNKKQF